MKDSHFLNQEFVKIVERYPVLYNSHMEPSYRSRNIDSAWDSVADHIRTELKEECTIEEIKVRWKGIRSSFNRYRKKLFETDMESQGKKYYLYDSLQFLVPYIHSKPKKHLNLVQSVFQDCVNFDDETSMDDENEWMDNDIKPNLEEGNNELAQIKTSDLHSGQETLETAVNVVHLKRKRCSNDENNKQSDDDDETLHFFKSILTDVKSFTPKEKRKLKIGVLRLIDEIEDSRKSVKSCNEVSSS